MIESLQGERTALPYESSRILGEYLLFHYGSPTEQFPWAGGPEEAMEFPSRSVQELIDPSSRLESALDLGCAVGKSTFVLSSLCDSVLGVDASISFIQAAQTILSKGGIEFEFHEEGSRWKRGMAKVDAPRENVSFEVGDACNLRNDLGCFDLVHAANLLCRLPDPRVLLAKLPDLVKPGGQLLLVTPFTWLEEFTPKQNWLESKDSESALKELLGECFDLEFEKNLPFLIREHRRKYQYGVALGMRWRRIQR